MRPAGWVQTRLYKVCISRYPSFLSNRPLRSPACIRQPRSPPCRLPDVYSARRNVPASGALSVGARARVPDRFVRHDVWLERVELRESLLRTSVSFPDSRKVCAGSIARCAGGTYKVGCSGGCRRSELALSFSMRGILDGDTRVSAHC